jgi:hypothetical protein
MIDRATEYEKAGANIKVFPKAPNVEVLSQQLRDYIKERFETNG